MITKFEKRVIAGILVILMCSAVIQFPALEVHAEENAIVSEMDAIEDVNTVETEIDLSEETFIPIQEEQEENDVVTEKTLEQEQNKIKDTPMKNVPDEKTIVEEVFVGEENQTEVLTSGEWVRYSFTPEKTGGYCFYIKGQGSYTIEEKDGNFLGGASSWDDLEEHMVLQKGTVYYIDITSIDSEHTTITWGIKEEIAVTTGKYETVTNGEKQKECYYFAPEKAGDYRIRLKGFVNCEIQSADEYKYIWDMEKGQGYVHLDSGEGCHITICHPREYIGNVDNTVQWSIEEIEIPVIKLGEKYEEITEENDWSSVYKFIPKESGKYTISATEYINVNFYEDNWNWRASGTAQLEAGQIYYIELSHYSDFEWSLKKTETVEIQEKQTYTTTSGQAIEYKFLPPKSGRYQINLDSEASFEVYDQDNVLVSSGYQLSGKIDLEKELAYYIQIRPRETVNWSIEEVEIIEVQEGTEYTTKTVQAVEYKFLPKESGYYQFSFDTGANFQLYDENWEYICSEGEPWPYNKKIDLEKGKVYYISLVLNEEVNWNVAKVEMIKVQEETEYTTIFNQPVYYEFVPKQTGTYFMNFKEKGTAAVYDRNWENVETYQFLSQYGVRMSLTAGETYYLEVKENKNSARWILEEIKISGDYAYRIKEDGTAELLKYLGKESALSVPETIVGKTVSSIGEGVFWKNDIVQEVKVPATVVEIQYNAFEECTNLQSVKFAPSSQLKKIEGYAFQYCEKLSDITIPNGVEKLGLYAFAVSGIIELNIPDSVTEVGNNICVSCMSLQSVEIGKGLTEISACMFNLCEKLQRIEFSPDSKITIIKRSAFEECKNLNNIVIPERVQKIETGAFYSSGITKINIPDSVTEVGDAVFSKCENLQTVTIGKGLKKITEFMFDGCTALTQIGFAGNETANSRGNVTEIEYGAFMGCSSLAGIDLPDSVKSMSGSSMRDTAWYDNHEDGVVYADQILYGYKGNVPENTNIVVKSGTKGIASFAFDGQTGLESIELPNELTTIETLALYNCESLKSVLIPASVTKIGKFALGYMKGDENNGILLDVDWVYGYAKKIKGFIIYGYSGSAAQQYAEHNGFRFISIGNIEPDNVFSDVKETDWFYDAVMYVSENKIMTGLTADTFGPDVTLTRAQFATILYRLNEEPDIDYSAKFPDIADGQWYTKGVLWANSIGVVGGYGNGLFGPEDNITREQMALMMYRYAKYKEYDISKSADISSFKDADSVSGYAVDAFKWAVGSEIIGGKAGNMLEPQGQATRAECAAIIMRFMEGYEK